MNKTTRWTRATIASILIAQTLLLINSPARAAYGVAVEKRHVEGARHGVYTYSIDYPKFSGGPLARMASTSVETWVHRRVAEFTVHARAAKRVKHPVMKFYPHTQDITYVVSCATPQVISFYLKASGSTGHVDDDFDFQAQTFAWRGGKPVRLNLSDAFRPGVFGPSAISPIVIAKLMAQRVQLVTEGELKRIDEPPIYWTWSVSPKGLVVLVPPGIVDSVAAGPYEMPIPFSALDEKLAVDGPLRSVIKG